MTPLKILGVIVMCLLLVGCNSTYLEVIIINDTEPHDRVCMTNSRSYLECVGDCSKDVFRVCKMINNVFFEEVCRC